MSFRLYVGNYPFTFTTQDVENLFVNFEGVRIDKIIQKKDQKKSFAFLKCTDIDQVVSIVKTMNGASISGRNLVVRASDESLQEYVALILKDDEPSSSETPFLKQVMRQPHQQQYKKEYSEKSDIHSKSVTNNMQSEFFPLKSENEAGDSRNNSACASRKAYNNYHQKKDIKDYESSGNSCISSNLSPPHLNTSNAQTKLRSNEYNSTCDVTKDKDSMNKTSGCMYKQQDTNSDTCNNFLQKQDIKDYQTSSGNSYFSSYSSSRNTANLRSNEYNSTSEITKDSKNKTAEYMYKQHDTNSDTHNNFYKKPNIKDCQASTGNSYVSSNSTANLRSNEYNGTTDVNKDSKYKTGDVKDYQYQSSSDNSYLSSNLSSPNTENKLANLRRDKYNSPSEITKDSRNNTAECMYKQRDTNSDTYNIFCQEQDMRNYQSSSGNSYVSSNLHSPNPRSNEYKDTSDASKDSRNETGYVIGYQSSFSNSSSPKTANEQANLRRDEYNNTSEITKDPRNKTAGYMYQQHDTSSVTWVSVTNFPLGISVRDLYELFSDYHPIDVRMICNVPRRDKMLTEAHVCFPSEDIAEDVILNFDNTMYEGRIILVNDVEDLTIMNELLNVNHT